MSDEADLDALIARIQSDLRSNRKPAGQRSAERADKDAQLRTALRQIRGAPVRRADLVQAAAKWLVPLGIIVVVGMAVMLFGSP